MAAESSGAIPACLEGKGPGERAAILHQHLGRREMTDIIIETIRPRAGTGTGTGRAVSRPWVGRLKAGMRTCQRSLPSEEMGRVGVAEIPSNP